ncbi:hypothetical protein [Sphingomicrobium arenosum]|uniref:hypothetical protein n=1 Tax=Sphingomicrobium arenosum TaxID=2233861 RepID=UPI0022408A9B|nr:hypothetical protein [Sphingomicrobium arenosum]
MPTKGTRGRTQWNYRGFTLSKGFRPEAVEQAFSETFRNYRYGSSGKRAAHEQLFDVRIDDLAKVPLGAFEKRPSVAPTYVIPAQEEHLGDYCRHLLDAGGDRDYIELLTPSFSLSEHVEELWEIRSLSLEIYREIVRGRFWKAVELWFALPDNARPGQSQFEKVVSRQLLLFCAFELQLAACAIRASFEAPLGELFSSTQKEVKEGTIRRESSSAEDILKVVSSAFDPTAGHSDKIEIKGIPRALRQKAKKIAESMSDEELKSANFQLGKYVPRLSDCWSHAPGEEYQSSGKLNAHFFAGWTGGINHVEGLAITVIRFVQAEQHVADMVATAFEAVLNDEPAERLGPLPSLGADGLSDEQKNRAFEILHHVRRVHLRDTRWRSRTTSADLRRFGKDADYEARHFDLQDRAGLAPMRKATKRLMAWGQRYRPGSSDWKAEHGVYWTLDVLPEERLSRPTRT